MRGAKRLWFVETVIRITARLLFIGRLDFTVRNNITLMMRLSMTKFKIDGDVWLWDGTGQNVWMGLPGQELSTRGAKIYFWEQGDFLEQNIEVWILEINFKKMGGRFFSTKKNGGTHFFRQFFPKPVLCSRSLIDYQRWGAEKCFSVGWICPYVHMSLKMVELSTQAFDHWGLKLLDSNWEL